MKKILILTLFCAFTFLSCESDDFEISKTAENNSISVSTKPSVTEIEVQQEVIDHDELIYPESITEISNSTTRISVRTATPKQNVYLNNIYRGKTPLVITDLVPGYYELSIENIYTQNSIKHKIITNNYLIEVKNGESQNYYFGD